ncbi:LCP family protein [Anaerococcus sp. AGMB00486]|uniref:LCP family protein n=2 Tax=Anaerococcus TaxID=165779 RepID=A0ABX2NB94_9FIRM|nr:MULTISPECIES: LCP family protein [Anaerococcus]MDY3006997.1 LCP family protein [Anaerococcus porci]MSS78182.1 LytR family transcriptional regulator [Anaerococcus porci]NVF11940.1 LCP family protein [Anaerococcus faecalis]
MKNIKKTIIKLILIILMAITLFLAIFVIKGLISSSIVKNENNFIGDDLSDGNTIEQRHKDELFFLFAGVDSTGEKTNTRTDTLMLVLMNKSTKTIDIISIPRDTRVYIEGELDKINAAHSYGGMDMTIKTIRDFLGIDLDYYCEVNFQAVVDGVDALGGIDIDVKEPIANAQDIEPGLHRFNGQEALNYVRFRKGYSNADLGRIATQQDFLVQFISELSKPSKLLRIPMVFSKLSSNMDTNINYKNLLSFGWAFKNISQAQITTYTIPGYPDTIDGISYYIPDSEATIDIRNQVLYNYLLEE